MIVAQLYRGPYDGKSVVLPAAWSLYVIPEFGIVDLEWFYLRSGLIKMVNPDMAAYAYLFDTSFGGITPDEFAPPS